MSQFIIYSTLEGGVAIIVPAINAGLPLEEIARKDVPAGVAYKIVSAEDFPTDRTFRNAWEVQIDEPDGYGIGPEAWFAEQTAKKDEQEAIDVEPVVEAPQQDAGVE